jgi:nucleoside 2-deoxyribosyltransferase
MPKNAIIDMLGSKCPECFSGCLEERCFFDDLDGVVWCPACGLKTQRWPKRPKEKNQDYKKEIGVLYKTRTYLIGPMQYADGAAWREDMTGFLRQIGVVVFDPYKKPFIDSPDENSDIGKELQALLDNGQFDVVESHMKRVRAFDLSMVDRCDFIIGYVNPTVPTFGTMEELSWAVRMKRPVFLVIEGGIAKAPFWLFGMLPHKYFYESFDDLKEMLGKINTGEKEIDSDRWRLFKPELR